VISIAHTSLIFNAIQPRDSAVPEAVGRVPSETGDENVPLEGKEASADEHHTSSKEGAHEDGDTHLGNSASEKDPKTRKAAKGAESFEKWERDEMEKLLGDLNGHLGMLLSFYLC
jgi:phospholipase D1/2